MVLQVSTLMWMRTTMNYQYKNGGTTMQAWKTLYRQGGLVRFYRGYFAALAQGPLSRFGDTAANTGVLVLLNRLDATKVRCRVGPRKWSQLTVVYAESRHWHQDGGRLCFCRSLSHDHHAD